MPNGILIIDKPQDWTSMDVCAKVRGIFHEKRVGHGGTLDPLATGVLPVFVGQATKGVEFAENSEKEYIAGLRLGIVTDTQDTTGAVLETHPVTADRAAVEAALARFTGPSGADPAHVLRREGERAEALRAGPKGPGGGAQAPARHHPRAGAAGPGGRDGLPAPLPVLQGHLHPHPLPRHRTGPGLRRGHVLPAADHGRRLHAGPGGDAGAGPGGGGLPAAAHRQPLCRVSCGAICPRPGRRSGSAAATPSPCRTCRTAPAASTARTGSFCAFPGRRAASSRPSRISLERKP